MLKPLLLSLSLLVLAAPAAEAQNQLAWPPEDSGSTFVQPYAAQPYAGAAPQPGINMPDASQPASLLPPPPVALRQITAARPVVVELFTSEGCSSCPPADQYMTELAERRDLLALSFHVDYWDYIGWQDRFAAPAFTQRQRDYAKAKGERMVYTPQIVIAGAVVEVGSDRVAVEAGLRAARNRKVMAEPLLARDGNDLRLTLPAINAAKEVWILASGSEKASAVRLALTEKLADVTAIVTGRAVASSKAPALAGAGSGATSGVSAAKKR